MVQIDLQCKLSQQIEVVWSPSWEVVYLCSSLLVRSSFYEFVFPEFVLLVGRLPVRPCSWHIIFQSICLPAQFSFIFGGKKIKNNFFGPIFMPFWVLRETFDFFPFLIHFLLPPLWHWEGVNILKKSSNFLTISAKLGSKLPKTFLLLLFQSDLFIYIWHYWFIWYLLMYMELLM